MAGLAAVDPTRLVKARVRTGALDAWLEDRHRPRPIHVVALGKAAPRMVWGLVEANVPFSGIGAAPAGVPMPQWQGFAWHRGEHPVPGRGSFAAGRAVLEWADALPRGAKVLALLSGGASACVEDVDDEAATVADWRGWLHAGMPIEEMNRRRAKRSHVKGGRLGKCILDAGAELQAWVLCDAPVQAVGSGPFWDGQVPHVPLADAGTALGGAAKDLIGAGIEPFAHASPIAGLADVAGFLEAAHGLSPGQALLGAGEPAFSVPADAPPGGRCQHAALAAAGWLAQHRSPVVFLAGATDGVDGATAEAGAVVSAADADPAALARFAAHGHLLGRRRTFRTGPTGTNVGDVWLAIHPSK